MTGKVVLLTGGGGVLGKVFAEALSELGANIFLIDIDAEGLIAAADDLKGKYQVGVEYKVLDLESPDQVAAVAVQVHKMFGRLDVLVNNAAFVGANNISGWVTDFPSQTLSTWRRALEVNLTSAFSLSQQCYPMLKESGNGVIINIGSIYGELGPDMKLYKGTTMGNPAAYAASKGGLLQLTRWLSTVLAPEVRVNAISPGGVERDQPDVFCQRYIERTPLARMANEEDFKGSIAYLASDLSRYVTGQNLVVDGGWSVW